VVALLRLVSVKEVVLAPTVAISVKFVFVSGLRSILNPVSVADLSVQVKLTLDEDNACALKLPGEIRIVVTDFSLGVC